MPALIRREEPANFNAVLVLVQQQWMKALLSLEDDVLILNFEDTYAFDDDYGDHGSRPRPPSQDGFPVGSGDVLTGQKRIVKIVKEADAGLGISIKGGRENRMPVVISKIFENMAAATTGQLHCGDAILSCNGFDLSNASHDDCVAALRCAGSVVILEGKTQSHLFAEICWLSTDILWCHSVDDSVRLIDHFIIRLIHWSIAWSIYWLGVRSIDWLIDWWLIYFHYFLFMWFSHFMSVPSVLFCSAIFSRIRTTIPQAFCA